MAVFHAQKKVGKTGLHTMPDEEMSYPQNLVICMTATGGCRSGFGVLMVGSLPDLHIAPDGAQSFPLYIYDLDNKNEQ
ncbi:type ISP restriction/modification enzyme [Acetobacter ghanensis]|uniref:type ISP restriction/modification enzyme n=1 Tax=Acetobacter ghanensis TaxID=431306 RepID=UPI003D32F6D8